MKYSRSVDYNQPKIVTALREAGRSVILVNCEVDILVGFEGATYILEIKNPKTKYKLRDSQKKLLETWQGAPIHIVTTVEEALEVTSPWDALEYK